MNPRAKIGRLLAFCASLGLHGVAYASLGGSQREAPVRDFVSEVSIEVKAPPLEPALPETPAPPPEPIRAKSAAVSPANAPVPTLRAVPASLPARPAAAPAALDLSGVTLTNDTGAGFAMPLGDGSALHGPIGMGRQSAAAPAPLATPAPPQTAWVAASDLSEHPVPPALAGLLRANYPEEARQRGLRGSASVRARIDPDGVVRAGRLVSESAPGFGAACRRTVVGSRWSAPRDKNGGAVATEIVYTCHFEVDP